MSYQKNKSIVSAQRFMNDVLFYDLKGNIRTVVTLGSNHILPKIKDRQVDMKNSTKYFIYICGTTKHVYCLYDGNCCHAPNCNSRSGLLRMKMGNKCGGESELNKRKNKD